MSKTEQDDNYYAVLGVARGADTGTIRTSYRRLMQQAGNHPDLGGSTGKAALINKAYATLCDPVRRREYDARYNVIELVARGVPVKQRQREPEPPRPNQEGHCLFCQAPHECVDVDDMDSTCISCGSPVAKASKHLFEAAGQRTIHRVGKSLALRFYTRWPQARPLAARTEDISPNGLRMVTRCPVSVGQRIRVVSNLLHAVGTVVHCETRRNSMRREYVAGIVFETLRLARSSGGFLSRLA